MGAMKQALIRDREARSCEPCPDCEARHQREMEEDYYFERDTAAKNPARSPGHRPATDAEWWDFILGC